jgi:hypothetical protein
MPMPMSVLSPSSTSTRTKAPKPPLLQPCACPPAAAAPSVSQLPPIPEMPVPAAGGDAPNG